MKKLGIFILCIFISVSSSLAGGPWPQKKGKGYFKLSEWWIIFDAHFTEFGQQDPNVTTGVFNTNAYAEYGLSNRLTGLLNGTLFSRNYMNNLVSGTTGEILTEGESLNSIGDIDLGVKYAISKPGSKIPVSASLILGLPTGKTGKGTQGALQTGDGEFNQMIQVDAGLGLEIVKPVSTYISTYVGFNNRTNEFSEEFRYGGELGLGFLKDRLWVIGRLYGVKSFENGATSANITSTSIFANNTEYFSSALEVNLYLNKKLGVSVSTASASSGQIIAAAPSFSVGVFYDFSK